ncbi:MAG TPA: hypothetical protein ENI05_13110 [Porticoccus sp.]|nr:hypothetical protein [Porticoccus sp.]
MTNFSQKPILITGLPRSGTSMVAGVLSASGAWSGSTVQGNEANPKGFFEHIILREKVVKPILEQLKVDPLGVRSVPNLQPDTKIEQLGAMIYNIIKSDNYAEKQPWLFKDAKLTLIWPIFVNAFPKAQWVIVRRPIERVIDSCLKASFMQQHSESRDFWQQVMTAYLKKLEELTKTAKNVICIDTDRIINGNTSITQQLVEQCGLTYDQNIIDSFVDKQHWHHHQ